MQIFNEYKRRGKKVDLFADNSDKLRLKRKLVAGRKSRVGKNKAIDYDATYLTKLTDSLNEQIADNEALQQILPDIKLASQVLVSGILAPKDLMTYELNYKLNSTVSDKNINNNVIQIIKEYFEEEYDLVKLAPKILKRALFISGSYPMLVLPETTVDTVINSNCTIGTEDFKSTISSISKNIGFLGTGKSALNAYTSISDNFNMLKLPWINDKKIHYSVENILSGDLIGCEAKKEKVTDPYLRRQYSHVPVQPIHLPSDDGLYGEPLALKLPSESVVPIHVPSDPTTHIGYFILIDKNGYPVNGVGRRNEYDKLKSSRTRCSDDGSANLIRETKLAIYGDTTVDCSQSSHNQQIYCNILEMELCKRIKNGIYGESVELSDISKISNIMLARALAEKHTTILYVPKELITYFTFDYNRQGLGKSLLDDGKILSSLRSVLLLANVLASIKNSVPRTGVKINLDANDPDPQNTVEFLLHEFLKNHNQSFPIGLTNPTDIADAIQRSSIDLVVTGNAAYPETSIDVNDKTRSVAKPDTELENQMRRRHYMSMGLPPELIDADMNIDFATMIVSSNLLTAKSISIYQKLFTADLSRFIQTYVRYSTSLKDKLKEAIGDSKLTLNDVINAIEVFLPEPDNSKLENQLNAFRVYSDALNTMLEAYFSSDMLGRTLNNELEDAIEPTINCIKSYYLRQWLRNNNVLPELDALTNDNSDSNLGNLNLAHKEHLDSIIESVGKLLLNIRKEGREWIDKLDEDEREAEEAKMRNEEQETPEEPLEEGTELPEVPAEGEEPETPETPEEVAEPSEEPEGGEELEPPEA